VSKKRKVEGQVEDSQLEVYTVSLHLIVFLLVLLKFEFVYIHIFLPDILYSEIHFNSQEIINASIRFDSTFVLIGVWNSKI
jgi:hypothetical protein